MDLNAILEKTKKKANSSPIGVKHISTVVATDDRPYDAANISETNTKSRPKHAKKIKSDDIGKIKNLTQSQHKPNTKFILHRKLTIPRCRH